MLWAHQCDYTVGNVDVISFAWESLTNKTEFVLYLIRCSSLSNLSSDFSNKSSLNDSGVVGDQELDNVSNNDKHRYQASHTCNINLMTP